MARYDMFGHDKREREERDAKIKARNEAYFNRKKKPKGTIPKGDYNPESAKSKGGFKGLSPSEKRALKKGVKTTKKVAKKVGSATASGAKATVKAGKKGVKAVYSTAKKGLKKAKKGAKAGLEYSKFAAGTAVGKAERSKAGRKAKQSFKDFKKSVKEYNTKHGPKKKPKYNMTTGKWE